MGQCAEGDLWTPDCTGALCPDDPECPVGTYATTDVSGCAVLPCISLTAVAPTSTTISATAAPATATTTTMTSGIDSGVAAIGLVALFALIMMGEG